MFDWDDVPEELGGPNRATLEISAEVEEEDLGGRDEASRKLSSRLCLDEAPTTKRLQAKASLQKPTGQDRTALRGLRVGELRRRLAEAGVKIPPDIVEKDDLVSLLMSAELEARAAEAEARSAARAAEADTSSSMNISVAASPEDTEGDLGEAPQESRGRDGRGANRKAAAKKGPDTRPPSKRLERMTAAATQDETPLQKSLRLEFQKMKESQQRQREEAQRRAARKSEGDDFAAERRTLDIRKDGGQDAPGPYIVTKKTFATASADRGGEKVDNLIPGQVVDVLEVVHLDGRVRARISDPPCWFSIANNDTGTRFAEKQELPVAKPNTRKAPSRFAAFSKAAANLREESPEPVPVEAPRPLPVEASKPSALALAAKSGSFKKVMKLLQDGANVHSGSALGETPLFEAAAGGSIDVVAALLLHSADAEKKSQSYMVAADFAPTGPLKSLLELAQGSAHARADMGGVVNAVDPLLRPQITHMLQEKLQASMMAQQMDRPTTVQNMDSFSSTAAARVAPPGAPQERAQPQEEPKEESHPPRALAEEAAKVAGESTLTRATKAGNLKEVMRLLQGKADPNSADVAGETPLFEAAAYGFADVTAALLVHGADPERKSLTGLVAGDMTTDGTTRGLLAFFRGDDLSSEVLEFILDGLGETMHEIIGRMVHSLQASKRGIGDGEVGEVPAPRPRNRIIDTGNLSEAPLAAAARAGDLEEVRRLLQQGSDPNFDDDLGETPLFESVSSGFSDITALLLLHKADPLKKSDAGGQASDLAVDKPCKLLLDFFKGTSLSNEEKYEVVYGALQDEEIRGDIAARFRAENMQEAYQHTLRKLRA